MSQHLASTEWRRRKIVSRRKRRPALNVRGTLWELTLECGHQVERTGGAGRGARVRWVECHRCQFAGEFQ